MTEELADLLYESPAKSAQDCVRLASDFTARFRESVAQELLDDGWGYAEGGPEDYDQTQRYAAWIVRGRPKDADW